MPSSDKAAINIDATNNLYTSCLCFLRIEALKPLHDVRFRHIEVVC